jgi:plasmid maintenance system antidote protein VapI
MGKRLHKSNTNRRRGNATGKPTLVNGFSIVQIARGTNYSTSQISRVFSGSRSVSLDGAARISRYIGLSIDSFHTLLVQIRKSRTSGKNSGH